MLQITNGQRIGRFQVLGFLGRGAFAQVFLAEGRDGRRVALKLGDESGGGRFLHRFHEITGERNPMGVSPDETPAEAMFLDPVEGARAEVLDASEVDLLLWDEARLLEQAKGEGFPELYDVAEVDGRPVLVEEAIDGYTIRERIRSLEGIKLSWLLEVARKLERTQEWGWGCHGDVKPENIIIGVDERVVLLDPVAATDRHDLIVTTPWYNPFLLRSAKGDAQALGVILYELLCGALPFEQVPFRYAGCGEGAAPSDDRDLLLSMFLSFPRPRDINPRSPRELDRILHRTVADENYSLPHLRHDLESFLLVA